MFCRDGQWTEHGAARQVEAQVTVSLGSADLAQGLNCAGHCAAQGAQGQLVTEGTMELPLGCGNGATVQHPQESGPGSVALSSPALRSWRKKDRSPPPGCQSVAEFKP